MKISFIASHGGSSARHIIAAIEQKTLAAELGVVITNNSDSAILRWCQEQHIPVHLINAKTHPDPESEDLAIMNALAEAQTDLVVLSGYMKKIGPHTLARFNGHILNIHPALLPKHGGHGLYGDRVHEAVLKSGDTVSGASVHLINERYDEGPVLKQSHVPILPDDTVASLRARVQATEGDLYLETLKDIIEGKL
ncbi:phosphoribosylglycinamide formyltransferase [Methylobacter sp. YRD-M1]|uniref:phosphoribosylglycinamide formyltransferase n=1 Tax=Methylobacter sp. YRD-M1 TaxID=2911520 RepID=UPI00227A6028|nr:phosphoribosylglycinamide formyltransferase [Methylobacter sp. YRD-M1]WAK02754.1 phosphoribosylglycinamide formyltransferase [Methylobacter sp. YRD-M1]